MTSRPWPAILGNPLRSLDRLAGIRLLRTWKDNQELRAIIGARHAGWSWSDIADAVGVTTQDATAQSSALIGRYEAAGLLAPAVPTCAQQETKPRRYP
jgi:hypothetical protein